jgi:uncharacterized membrane protein YqjE
MNASSDIGAPAGGKPASGQYPNDWKKALAGLISSRLSLIRLESHEVTGTLVKRLVCLVVVAICALFAWCLILAGGISLIAHAAGWRWDWVALGAAALHLVVAGICVIVAKGGGATAFPVTKAEFKKDLEWLQTFPTNKKSNG